MKEPLQTPFHVKRLMASFLCVSHHDVQPDLSTLNPGVETEIPKTAKTERYFQM